MGITEAEGLVWNEWTFRTALTEPAFFYMQLFSASGSLVKEGRMKSVFALWLRGQTVRCINEALADPARALSTATILAVGRIALHESLYRDKEAARVMHRPAQQRMIAMRGGMDAFTRDLPPLVVRLLHWSDRIMSLRCGTPLCFPDMARNDKDQHRSVALDVAVMDRYVPGSFQRLPRSSKV
jgi:hypothetical protein